MKTLLTILLLTALAYSDDCSESKRRVAKYMMMMSSVSAPVTKINFIDKAIQGKKDVIYSCFLSGTDKERIWEDISDLEYLQDELSKEVKRVRRRRNIDNSRRYNSRRYNQRRY